MNHKKSRVLAAAISSLLSFGMILQTAAPPPQVYASEGIRRESSQKASDWTFKAADKNDQTAVTEVVKSDAYLSGLEIKGGSLDKPFSREFSSYSVVVGHKTDSLTIIPKIDGNAAVTVDGKAAGSGQAVTVNVKTGSNVFNIVVKGANGKTETTAVNVLRNSDPDDVYSVPYRSQYHFSPQRAWCNDPNGMVYYKGEYHLFYQYYPYGTSWGPMHWGHQKTKDFIKWELVPCALAPDTEYDGQGCFSGSAVEHDGKHILMYTSVYDRLQEDGTHKIRQTQSIAIGDGVNYEKLSCNPVIKSDALPEGSSVVDFRDPRIWKEKDTFYSVIGSLDADGSGQLALFSSADAVKWQFKSILDANGGRYGKMWECPDFFPLDGSHVLIVSPQFMRAEGLEFHNGHNSIYFVGSFDEEIP